MTPKKILLIPPDTPDPSYIDSVVSPLNFLAPEYSIHPVDSLSIMDDVPLATYYLLWQEKLRACLPYYDAFFGFSLGGVILQQCFSLFATVKKPIILFSTPSFVNDTLANKLNEVIALCKINQLDKALQHLYQYVYYPNQIPLQSTHSLTPDHAAQRVIYGLTRVLETDSTPILQTTTVNHLHLIGDQSRLVNQDNVIAPHTGTLLKVPEAGMRMLRDNPSYCQKVVLEALNSEQ